ncbi:MAG TPA: MBL fold metallo-hydrolase [Gemmatimonadaceae bacterium]|nr:MBL fold metallo-hydrolase [Gemmatimonadaceae bacterium]
MAAPETHHTQRGFRNPWPDAALHGYRDFLRWVLLERRRNGRAPDPAPGVFPLAQPLFDKRVGARGLAATWVGHSTVLLQLEGINVLTDPIWSERASPLPMLGPRRFVEPGVGFADLPPIDLVLVSHNHYDHLDRTTVRRLAARSSETRWLAPLGLGGLLRRWGARHVQELDWWEEMPLEMPAGVLRVGCAPAQHFSARGLGDRGRTLWCSWAILGERHRVFFAGDTAYHPEFARIAARFGPFDLVLLPVGAYEPRWFMRSVHMNPDDALRAYRDLTSANAAVPPPAMLPIHWGTFRLTDEAMTDPPAWTQRLWREQALDPTRLWLLQHGETRRAWSG